MIETVKQSVLAIFNDRKGISSLEYGVLAVGIVTAVGLAAVTVGTKLTSVFAGIVTSL